jgi:hypothetical protein
MTGNSVASDCCGEPPRYVRSFGRWKLICDRCGRNSSLDVYEPTIARAIAEWNATNDKLSHHGHEPVERNRRPRQQEDMKQHGLPVKNRYAEGWCEGKYFCIEVAPGETLAQLKKHFRETVGHDRIQVRRWYWA